MTTKEKPQGYTETLDWVQRAGDALRECAKIAVAPFAPQDNLTPEQCVNAVRGLRESCNAYVNKAGELLATRSRQLESQVATIRGLQTTNTDQAEELKRADVRRADLQTRLDAAEKRVGEHYEKILGLQETVRKLEAKLHAADKRERQLDHMVEALHTQIRNLCEARKITFLVGESYQTALGRIGLALLEARRPSNVTDVPRAVSQPAPSVETFQHAVAKLNELCTMNENNAAAFRAELSRLGLVQST
jgi:chromosome segregation ATPase